MRNYIYYCPKKINSSLLKSATKLFVGKHDFLSFTISTLANTTRKIDYIKINKAKSQTIITIKGQGFLRAMIRMLIGSLLDLNSHTKTLKDIEYLLNNPKKGSSISKVDGCGLYLYQVCY
jgi:tRNA pseudouridine38-40 synthase